MTGNKRNIGSDLAKVDAYVNTAADYAELPELDDAFFERAKLSRGRPALGDKAKQAVSIRLNRDAIEAFKATGTGWQTRINDVVVRAAKRLRAKA